MRDVAGAQVRAGAAAADAVDERARVSAREESRAAADPSDALARASVRVRAQVDGMVGGRRDAALAWVLLPVAADVASRGHSDAEAREPEMSWVPGLRVDEPQASPAHVALYLGCSVAFDSESRVFRPLARLDDSIRLVATLRRRRAGHDSLRQTDCDHFSQSAPNVAARESSRSGAVAWPVSPPALDESAHRPARR